MTKLHARGAETLLYELHLQTFLWYLFLLQLTEVDFKNQQMGKLNVVAEA